VEEAVSLGLTDEGIAERYSVFAERQKTQKDSHMHIKQITEDKRAFLPLLLLADETEDAIDEYLDRGELFALYDDGPKAVCVVTDEGNGVFELQNIAVDNAHQRKGYGRTLVKHIFEQYMGRGKTMLVGTGDSPPHIAFYEACGFVFSHRMKDYILERYGVIFENGVQLRDKIYLTKEL